jgi:hypothetical protein
LQPNNHATIYNTAPYAGDVHEGAMRETENGFVVLPAREWLQLGFKGGDWGRQDAFVDVPGRMKHHAEF